MLHQASDRTVPDLVLQGEHRWKGRRTLTHYRCLEILCVLRKFGHLVDPQAVQSNDR